MKKLNWNKITYYVGAYTILIILILNMFNVFADDSPRLWSNALIATSLLMVLSNRLWK